MGLMEMFGFGGAKEQPQAENQNEQPEAEMTVEKPAEEAPAESEEGAYDSGVKFEDLNGDYDALESLNKDIENLGKEDEAPAEAA